MDLEERYLLLIPAVPSSGSSALAGVLHHLGVNMGNVNTKEAEDGRGYDMFEDADTSKFTFRPNREPDVYIGKLTSTVLRVRSYVNYRLWNDEGPIGAKIPGVLCVYDPELETVPIITLNIHRPLEQCIASDRATSIRQNRYDPIKGDMDKVWAANRMRASDMGSCLAGKMDVFNIHEPVVNLSFDELINEKEEMVPQIAKACGLEPSDEQLQTAIDFLDKDKKHS